MTERLGRFIPQRDHSALIIRCGGAETIAVLKILEGLAESSSSELFWKYTGDFTSPADYASAVVKDFQAKHEAATLLMKREGMRPWPAIPEDLLSDGSAPVLRLRRLVSFSRSLLPTQEGALCVWIFFPMENHAPDQYAALMGDLLHHDYPFPWYHHVRFFVRDDAEGPVLSQTLQGRMQIDFYQPDLSHKAIETALEQDAADERLPLVERMQAVLLIANNDYAHKRFREALARFELLYTYYDSVHNLEGVGLALNGAGESQRRLGNWEQASDCFEAAVHATSESNPPPLPLLLNILLNLANLRMDQARWSEAEFYYFATDQLATVLRNPASKVQSIENRGYCQYMQGKSADAIATWRLGEQIASELGQEASLKSLQGRLQNCGAYGQPSLRGAA